MRIEIGNTYSDRLGEQWKAVELLNNGMISLHSVGQSEQRLLIVHPNGRISMNETEEFSSDLMLKIGEQARTTIPTDAAIYSHDRWNKMIEETFDEVRHLAKAKGGEYSGDTDRLLNFRRNGLALGLPMETIWGVYSAKHWDAIMQYIRDLREGKERERLESIDGRIRDLIVYLLLLQAMIEERHA